jgi:acyl carrier protein
MYTERGKRMETSIDIIREFVVETFAMDNGGQALADDLHLIDQGVIDSLGIVKLIAFMEQRFSISIPADELLPENFESVIAISDLVDRRLMRYES